MRRHLSACPVCRVRVEHLREFERDLQHSFRSMERAQSVWAGLEPDLVRSGGLAEAPPVLPFLGPAEPPRSVSALVDGMSRRPVRAPARPDVAMARQRARRARIRRWSQRAVGVAVMLAATLGGVALWRSWSDGDIADAPVRAYTEWRSSDSPVQFATTSPESLRLWLAHWLGDDLPALPAPSGFDMIGGTVDELAVPVRGVVIYHHGGEATLLLVAPQVVDAPLSTVPVASVQGGLSQLRWSHAGFVYSLVSPLPTAELAPFRAAEAQPS